MNRDETYQDVCVNPNRHPGLSNQPSNRHPREGSIVASHISDLLELRLRTGPMDSKMRRQYS